MAEKEHKTLEVNAFSNGSEYHLFLEKNCYRCRHYVDWEEADNPECETEAALAAAYWDIKWWPAGKIKMDQDPDSGQYYIPHCIDFEQEDPK